MKKAILILLSFISITNAFAQVVQTQFGPIQGAQNGGVIQFLGVPFASPPVNDLRWKAPEDPTSWGSTLQTTAFAPACPQKLFQQGDTTSTLIGDEDCLYLNIWTPQTGTGNRAVMVFIHGGGNQQGSASEENGGTQMYFGKNMAQRGDVVVVTIQYRLGPLGFLVHPGLAEENVDGIAGNYAVMDQILALKWVKNNIANFGGDPDRVMIFGESAGGTNVGNLLTTPLAAGLFQRACIQSAAPVVASYATGENKGTQFVNTFPLATGSNANKIAYMRSLPADSLTIKSTSPLQGGVTQMNWQAVIDNHVFFNSPINVFQSGNFNNVPLMLGSNSEEMSLSSPQVVTPAMVNLLVNSTIPVPFQAQVLALYPPGTTNSEAKQSYVGILTDAQFTTTARRTAECVSRNQTEPVYRYFYSHKHTIQALQPFGAYHGMELFYVFNNWENATLGQGVLFKPADDSVQNIMLSYWANFAKTGNPNGNGLVAWPQYNADTDCYLEIKATPNGSQCGIRTAQSDLWDAVAGFQGCTGTGVEEDLASGLFTIFPNPAGDNVTINWNGNTTANLRVFDMSGKQVTSLNKITNGYSLPTTNLTNGIYLVQVISGNNIISKKLVVQH
jgi:para-nitrobenzyl esterase